MKKYINYLVIVFIVFLSVGYTSVNTFLQIEETTSIAINLDDLDIYISSLYVDSVYSNSMLDDNRDQFMLSSNNQVVDYSLTNNSKNYDMQAVLKCTNSENIQINIEQDSFIPAQETVDGKLYINNSLNVSEDFLCLISKTYLEKNNLAEDKKVVIFDADNGSVDVGYKVIEGMVYGDLPDASLDLFSFKGWYDSLDGGNKIISSSVVDNFADQILYAKYERPIAPVLSVSSLDWSDTQITVSLSKNGSGLLPVKNYEYYVTNEKTKPSDFTVVTGVTDTEVVISNHGIWYVYYRTVTEDNAKSEWSDGVTVKIDKNAPNIVSVEPSKVLQITNSVKFIAQDQDSEVAYYNVSSTNVEPPNWIPVTEFVEEDTETVYKLGASWAKIFSHDILQGGNYFSSQAEVLLTNSDYKYSVLANLENYRNNSGAFEFLLEYPEVSSTLYNRWEQSDNLATVREPSGTGSEFAAGYKAINISWPGMYWGGLLRSSTTSTFIDGSIGHVNWYFAIGIFGEWMTSMPGPIGVPVSIVRLYNRIDDKVGISKSTLAATIGDIGTNGEYYLFVKDAVGNITSKKFTISKVGDASLSFPTVSGGGTTWANSRTYTLSPPYTYDGIANYEYYVSTSNVRPSASVTATGTVSAASSSHTISDTGTYIYFRSVNNKGIVGEWSNAYNHYVDGTAPVINSITPATSIDMTSYALFNATDNFGVAYYNVSTSSSTPTTWIPVTSFTESSTPTKYAYSASWARVFHHNARLGTVLFANQAEALACDKTDKYSVLGNLENYRNTSSVFEFLLEYPDLSATQYNRWIQSDNPATVIEPSGTGNEVAAGYKAINISWTTYYWGGLLRSTTSSTLIDGSIGHGNWYYAVGTYIKWQTSIPGPQSAIDEVDLWVRIDDKSVTTKTNLTASVGGMTTNGTYYLHVKDSAGNVSYKTFVISNIG